MSVPMKRLVEKLAFIGFPKILFEMASTYFRVEVEGLEYIPRRGKVLIVPNHSGCSGIDAIMLGHVIHRNIHRIPRILTLWTLFQQFPHLACIAQKMGLQAASSKNGLNLLRKNNLTVLFPEGVRGSFKPTCDRYRLQPFHTGFARMALISKSPVIPCVIIGAEESNINLAAVQFDKHLNGMTMPVPFNIIPLPAKWKIKFLPPIDLSAYTLEDSSNKEKMKFLSNRVRELMQKTLDSELLKRKYIYFGTEQNLLSYQSP